MMKHYNSGVGYHGYRARFHVIRYQLNDESFPFK